MDHRVGASSALVFAISLFLPPVHAASATAAAEAAGQSLRKLTFPGKPWALVLDLPGFEFSDRSARSDGKGISVFGTNESSGLVVSIYLEHAAGPGDARDCRDYYQSKAKKGRLERRNVSLSERDGIALVEYYGPLLGDPALDNQRHLNAYLSHDGIWIDIHLSKPNFKPSDRALFDAVLGSVRIAGDTSPGRTTAVDSEGHGGRVSIPQSFNAPGGKWSVLVDLPGFIQEGSSPAYEYQGKDPTISAYLHSGMEWHGASVEMGIAMIVRIIEANRERDAVGCRASAWSRFKADRTVHLKEPRLFDLQDARMIEYLVTQMDGRQVEGKYVHAFYFRDGYCVGVSLFKTDFRPGDVALFDSVLQSIQFQDGALGDEPPIPPSK